MNLLKDDHLASLAADYNIAQFVSFSAGHKPTVRHSFLKAADVHGSDLEDAIFVLVRCVGSVNVRTFTSESTKSGPFRYGLTDTREIIEIVRGFAQHGLYTVVNETIDVSDGGVSGVALGGIVEFAPDATPRAVENDGTVRLSYELARELLQAVYGVDLLIPSTLDLRIEFSIHPTIVGLRGTHVVVWEREEIAPIELPWRLEWPNNFSRMLGDKAFGLLIAYILGAPVPLTTVIGRRVAPFTFGAETGSTDVWFRTCPVEPRPGLYSTTFGWQDPFLTLAREDPTGREIASVISQHAVRAHFSGGAVLSDHGKVEGVHGRGDQFMQGRRDVEDLPDDVDKDVRALADIFRKNLGPVRIEWVHDGSQAWVVQLHVVDDDRDMAGVIYPGLATRWLEFEPADGLDALRELASEARNSGAGIVVRGAVGITSHVGDILRKAQIPSRVRSAE